MAKKWLDANEIEMIHELPNKKLREIDNVMRKKPNFDKNSQGGKRCFRYEKQEKTS